MKGKHMQHASIRFARFAVVGLLVMASGLSSAMATDGLPSTGLGQSWPNATDVSASPRWHVYVFQRQGVRYIQVNDLNGKVHTAFAAAAGNFLGLPVGVDAAGLATPQEPLPVPASKKGEIVYQDAAVKVFVAPQADGSLRVFAASGDCTDPIECTSRIQ
ncbi:hypothetical protein ISN76_09785 [Dyella halodurans]|uniref:Uncharacterized protein n=1 Tax=Dyella halodurans TaxID=1920171 RepID=A0ABV9C1W8_9GAMM|nr:hypothetical protein [Dyella halodurans]